MSLWRAAVLLLALDVVCKASPTRSWTSRRGFGGHVPGAAGYPAFSRFAVPLPRFVRANAGFDSTPITFGPFSRGRKFEPKKEVGKAAEESVSGLAVRKQNVRQSDAVVFSDSSAAKSAPSADSADPPTVPVISSTVEEAKASSTSPKPSTDPEPDATDTSIFFPDQLNPLETKAGNAFIPECDGVPFMALNNETGRCQFLMMRTECPEGQWFILDRDTLEASCQPLPCPEQEVLFNGKCLSRDDAALCPKGMVVLINEYGDASCDCAVKNLYWPAHDRCYPAYRRGPCHVGHYLTVGDDGVRCSENVCFRDGSALWKASNHCHRLQDEADSPCALGRLDVDVETLELECVEAEPFAIFDLPVVRCSKGSKLDYGGRCKPELHQMFRSSFTSSSFTSSIARKSDCGEGYIVGISGRCLKAAKEPKRR